MWCHLLPRVQDTEQLMQHLAVKDKRESLQAEMLEKVCSGIYREVGANETEHENDEPKRNKRPIARWHDESAAAARASASERAPTSERTTPEKELPDDIARANPSKLKPSSPRVPHTSFTRRARPP